MLQLLMDVLLGAFAAEVRRLLDGLRQVFDAVFAPPLPLHALADQVEELLQRLPNIRTRSSVERLTVKVQPSAERDAPVSESFTSIA